MKAVISKAFGEKTVFDRLEIELVKGEVTCILGASGVGKTTLLRILAGLEPFEGSIENAPQKCAFVFQEARLLPYLTVAENLRYVGGEEARIDEVLEKAEILPLKEQKAGTLSGGEKQRAAFARAFSVEADTLLLDEPFSSLDTALKIRLWNTFVSLWEEKKPTAVIVTHDLEEAWALGHRILILKDGKIALDIRPKRSVYPTPYGETSEEKIEFIEKVLKK
ncbi:MAG: ABC transporter ATP-binding protein [Clostridia bacterium]|nr:ABC transporter ATP-binding protein [Clostridia bacterium]